MDVCVRSGISDGQCRSSRPLCGYILIKMIIHPRPTDGSPKECLLYGLLTRTSPSCCLTPSIFSTTHSHTRAEVQKHGRYKDRAARYSMERVCLKMSLTDSLIEKWRSRIHFTQKSHLRKSVHQRHEPHNRRLYIFYTRGHLLEPLQVSSFHYPSKYNDPLKKCSLTFTGARWSTFTHICHNSNQNCALDVADIISTGQGVSNRYNGDIRIDYYVSISSRDLLSRNRNIIFEISSQAHKWSVLVSTWDCLEVHLIWFRSWRQWDESTRSSPWLGSILTLKVIFQISFSRQFCH